MHEVKEELRGIVGDFGAPEVELTTVVRRAERRALRRRVSAGITAAGIVMISGVFLVRAFDGDGPALVGSGGVPGIENGPIAFSTGGPQGGTAEGFGIGIVDPRSGESATLDGFLNAGAWTADGSRLVFVRDPVGGPAGDMSIWTARSDGTDLQQLTDGEGGDYGPRWSPDGTRILFFRNGTGGTPSLMVMDADGSGAHPIAGSGEQAFFTAAWSPDGSRILTVRDEYSRSREGNPLWLAVTDADGSNEQVLVRDYLNQPTWSPDGSEIYFAAHGAVQAVDVVGGDVRSVLSGMDPQGLSLFAVSPDGTNLLFTQPIDFERGEELWVAGTDGSDPRLVAEGLHWREPEPTWSPDGTAIAFIRDGDIWTVDLTTGEETQVVGSPDHETLPAWGSAAQLEGLTAP